MKKSSTIVLTIFVSIIIIGTIYFISSIQEKPNIKPINTNLNQAIEDNTDDDNILAGNDCKKFEQEINNLIEKIKYCESDSNCILDEAPYLVCPFGCYLIRSKMFDNGEYLSLIETKIKNYQELCPTCLYECPYPPEQKNIQCINNICSDNRPFID